MFFYKGGKIGTIEDACKHAFKNGACSLLYESLDPAGESTAAELFDAGYTWSEEGVKPTLNLAERQAQASLNRAECYQDLGTRNMFENWNYDAAVAGDNDDQTLQASLDIKAQASRKIWIDTVAQVKEQIPIPTI